MLRRRLIRTQLNLLLLSVAAPLVGLLAFTIHEDFIHDQQQAGEAVTVLAQTLADDAAKVVADSGDLLERLARRGPEQLLDRARCDRLFDDLLGFDPRRYAVVTADATGRSVCEKYVPVEAARMLPLLGESAWIDARRAGRSEVGLVESAGIRQAVRSRALADGDGQTIGSVNVLIDVGRFAEGMDLSHYAAGTAVEIRDGMGRLLFGRPGPAPVDAGSAGAARILKRGLATGVDRGDDGRDRLYAVAPIRGTGWHAVAAMPNETILAPTRELAIRNILLASAIIASVSVLAWVIAGRISRPIRRMALAANTVAGGDLNARVEVSGPAEIAEVAEQFNAMVRARLDAEQRLNEAHSRLKTLSRRLIEVQESERRHIARELHDEVGQALTALSLRLQAQNARCGGLSCGAALEDCVSIADETLRQVRTLCLDLRPPQLDDLGLVSALRWQTDRQCQAAGIAGHVEVDGLEVEPPAEAATVAFRVAQEAVTNVVRHAGAGNVWIELRADPRRLHLAVRDDGCGFDVDERRRDAQRGRSAGLLSMEERVTLAGGEFAIESGPGRGTLVTVSLPLAAAQEET